MSWQRVLDDEQLERWATPLSIRLERAAEPLDREEIERIREQMDMECLAIYDAYVKWVGVLQTFVLRRSGRLSRRRGRTRGRCGRSGWG